jgi:hypothetical protein
MIGRSSRLLLAGRQTATTEPVLAVVTNRCDLTADWLVIELQRRDAAFVRLNTEDYPGRTKLRWSLGEAILEGAHGRLAADEITAVWWRRPLPPATHEGRSAAEAHWAAREATTAMDGFWAATRAHWVNHPAANASADCKPEQLMRAARLGLAVPPTLITAVADDVRAFADAHGQIVCKALRDGRVPMPHGGDRLLPTVLLPVDLEVLDHLGPEPSCFQALVQKTFDVRVTVIGSHAYACRIDSQGQPTARVDWRQGDVGDLVHDAVELPVDVRDRCLELTASYGLRFAAIDLAETADGDFVFFEINANGQWAWVEQACGLPLAAHLADELLGVTS